VFHPKPGAGVAEFLHTREMNFRDFRDRAGKVLRGLDALTIRSVKALLDPAPTAAWATVGS
jgi:hypothetical protein